MANVNAFARARAMMAAIQFIVVTTANPFDARMQIENLGPYRSRGHGRGKRSGVRVKAYAKMRAQHNKPIQGKQEIARRLRTAPKQTARRTWAVALDTPWGDTVGVRSSSRAGVIRIVNKLRATGNYRCEQSTPVLGVLHG